MTTDRKNYIDEKGNYHNVENLSLANIYQHGFYEGKKACYYKGHVPEADKWISVKERLPEDETDVLVCNAKGDMIVCRGSRSTEIEGEFIWYVCDWRYGNITHWKPLPKAPESEKGGAE